MKYSSKIEVDGANKENKKENGSGSTTLQTVYCRDSPTESPVFVATNTTKEGGKIVPLADNIFGALYQYLAKVQKIMYCTTWWCVGS